MMFASCYRYVHSKFESIAFHMLCGKQKNIVMHSYVQISRKLMHHIWHFKVLLEEDGANNSFFLKG